jgi:ketosteroid isomerase-like protein
MTGAHETSGPLAVVYRLRDAVNAHDLDALVDCFAPEFRSELPTFPDASFTGNENVRRNWEKIFSSVPDITAEVVRSTTEANTVWAEWQQEGTQRDGRPHLARGVVIFAIADGRIASNRFYVHPVRSGPPNVLDG